MFESGGTGYSSSRFAGKGYFSFLRSCSTSFMGFARAPDGHVWGHGSFLRSLMWQVGDLIVVLLDEGNGVVPGGGEVADIKVDAVVYLP